MALDVEPFFRHTGDGLTALTGELIFDEWNIPPIVLEFTEEYSQAQVLDELNYRHVKLLWKDTLSKLQAPST